ncbi:unnamed protein product, partial [Ectocarpus sp. 12 AP-2014]
PVDYHFAIHQFRPCSARSRHLKLCDLRTIVLQSSLVKKRRTTCSAADNLSMPQATNSSRVPEPTDVVCRWHRMPRATADNQKRLTCSCDLYVIAGSMPQV